mmetsp:Transcript_7026/g.23998  ORF Transcript_7026/g.23998 Transcript_7026/m.23998 type:complete len:210 (+) Transcript_7026:195-824(+)
MWTLWTASPRPPSSLASWGSWWRRSCCASRSSCPWASSSLAWRPSSLAASCKASSSPRWPPPRAPRPILPSAGHSYGTASGACRPLGGRPWGRAPGSRPSTPISSGRASRRRSCCAWPPCCPSPSTRTGTSAGPPRCPWHPSWPRSSWGPSRCPSWTATLGPCSSPSWWGAGRTCSPRRASGWWAWRWWASSSPPPWSPTRPRRRLTAS